LHSETGRRDASLWQTVERSATEIEAYFSQNIATCGSGSVGCRCRRIPV